MKRTALVLGLCLMFASTLVMAQSMPAPPRLPDRQESGEALEADVHIVETNRGREYRYVNNGRLYLVKVVPKRGRPYYLHDSNGDGQLDARSDDIREVSVHTWEIATF